MKWPFVSRAVALVLQANIDALQADVESERKRYDALLARYHALRVQGANVPEPPPVLAEKPFDPVLSAINDASAGKDAKVRAAMVKQAQLDHALGIKQEDIILRIQRGNRPAEEVG